MLRQGHYSFENNTNTLFYNHSDTLNQNNTNMMDSSQIILAIAVFPFLAAGAYALARHICQPKLLKTKNPVWLDNAIKLSDDECLIQDAEIWGVNEALNKLDLESRSYECSSIATESSALNGSSDKHHDTKLQLELRKAIDDLPKYPPEADRSLERFEAYIEARRIYHRKVVVAADKVLPKLSSVINEGRRKHGIPASRQIM